VINHEVDITGTGINPNTPVYVEESVPPVLLVLMFPAGMKLFYLLFIPYGKSPGSAIPPISYYNASAFR
jgi:hypothetical protein